MDIPRHSMPQQSGVAPPGGGYMHGSGRPGMGGGVALRPGPPAQQAQQNKSRRLYVGNIPYHVGIAENGMVQLFSALYVAGFRALAPGQPLPVASFWLHADGKFGFMELRGDQEAVDCMQFNGVVLHGRPLRVNRPSDYRPELGAHLLEQRVNAHAVVELCASLTGLVAPPAHIVAAASMMPAPPPTAPVAPPLAPVAAPVAVATPPVRGDGGAGAQPLMLRSQPPPPAAAAVGEPGVKVEAEVVTAAKSGKTVLALEHLVTKDDLDADKEDYDDLVSDITEECASYGEVVEVSIPRDGPGRGTAFIAYATQAEAKKALAALRERSFNGQLIKGVVLANQDSASAAAYAPRV